MTNNIYSIFNRLSNRYGECVSFASDSIAVKRIANNGLYRDILDEIEVCRVGKIDIENGLVTPEAAPIRVAIPDEYLPVKPAAKE